MEKRLFLAIGLSLLVMWLWSAVAPKPPMQPLLSDSTQTIESKEDTDSYRDSAAKELPPLSSVDEPATVEPVSAPRSKSAAADEKTEMLGSEKLTAEISNIGGALNKVTINEYDATLPIRNLASLSGYENQLFKASPTLGDRVKYVFEDRNVKVVKTYEIREGDYIIESGIEVYNKTEMSKKETFGVTSYVIEMSSLDTNGANNDISHKRDRALNEYVINAESKIQRKAGAFKFSPKEKAEEFGRILWSAFRDRYYCAIIKPEFATAGYSINPLNDQQMEISVKTEEMTIPPKSSIRLDSVIYVGPEETGLLKEYKLGFEKIKKYYRFGLFDGVAKIIDGFMHLIHKVVPNWGVCIILVSIIIYFSMYPLTLRGMQSMKKMQSLQPIIAGLKEKYKDKPEKMNKEMMEIYKEHKVNPLGGCLPMLLQMPVFIGLYQVLWRSVSFNGAGFLWIKDLSQPDRLFMMPFTLPVLGNEFNLLPVIMIIVMFFQQKLSAKNMVSADPAQQAQQKMMATIMPVFIGFIFYKFASGLTLYFTMFYIFSTLTQWKMSKQ